MATWIWVTFGIIAGILLILIAGAGFVWWKIYTSEEKKLARRIAKLNVRDKLSLAGALFGDPRIGIAPKLIAVGLTLYLASPLDLIPDFIPVVGYFDDLLIVIIGAGLLLRSIPEYVLEEHVGRVEEKRRREKLLEAGRSR